MLTDLNTVKSYLGIPDTDTSDDGFINLLIISIQTTIENYCKRHFDVATYTSEQHLVNHKIFTRETPIKSVASIVRLDGGIISNNNMTNYRVFPGYVELLDSKYVTMGNRLKYVESEQSYVEITYTAGYDTIPADLQLAAIKLIALEYKESREDRIGLESYGEGGLKETYYKKETEMPLSISCVLDRYKRVSV